MIFGKNDVPGMDVDTSDSTPRPVQNAQTANNIRIINVVPKKKPVLARFGFAAYVMGIIVTGIYILAVSKSPALQFLNMLPFAVFGFGIASFVCMLLSMLKEKTPASRALMAVHIGTIILFATAIFRV